MCKEADKGREGSHVPGAAFDPLMMEKDRDPVKRFDRAPLGVQFRLINEQLRRAWDHSMKAIDLSMAQMGVLICLDHMRDRKVSQKMLCDVFHVKHPTMVGILKRMEERGLVEQRVDESNRRARVVTLTPVSEAFLQKHKSNMMERDSHFLDSFTVDEKREFQRLLTKFYTNLLEFSSVPDTGEASD